jgi:DnaK suppressor protein
MIKTKLNAFRRVLENKQAEQRNGSGSREALAQAADRDYAMGNLERNSNRLREVRTAPDRIDAGTFGICATCEETISLKRLAAIPWASFCIVCQEALDHRQKTPQSEIETSRDLAA